MKLRLLWELPMWRERQLPCLVFSSQCTAISLLQLHRHQSEMFLAVRHTLPWADGAVGGSTSRQQPSHVGADCWRSADIAVQGATWWVFCLCHVLSDWLNYLGCCSDCVSIWVTALIGWTIQVTVLIGWAIWITVWLAIQWLETSWPAKLWDDILCEVEKLQKLLNIQNIFHLSPLSI